MIRPLGRALVVPVAVVSCAGAPAEPALQAASTTASASASASAETPPIGPPVMVSQRLSSARKIAELSPTGNLVLMSGYDGLHVIDAESGETRGVLRGCADEAGFVPSGHAVVAHCRGERSVRVWDLATDTSRTIEIAREHARLSIPPHGDRVAASGKGGFEVIDLARGGVAPFETAADARVDDVQIEPSGWISARSERTVTLFDPSGKRARRVEVPDSVSAHALTPTGTRIAVGTRRGLSIFALPGGERSVASPCPGDSIGALAWSKDEAHLVVSCTGRQKNRVAVLAPDGKEERELVQSADSRFEIQLAGDRVATLHPVLGCGVFEIASGRELHRIPLPIPRSTDVPLLSRTLERALFFGVDHIAQARVVDRDRGVLPARFNAIAASGRLARAGSALVVSGGPRVRLALDPAKGVLIDEEQGLLAGDGETLVDGGVRLVDRRTGARRVVSTGLGEDEVDARVSPAGAFLVAPLRVKVGEDEHEYRVWIFDAWTTKKTAAFTIGPYPLPWIFSPGDGLLAVQTRTARSWNGEACVATGEPDCVAVRVIDPRTGRVLTTIRPADRQVAGVAFTSDGKRLVVSGRVYDARTGRVAWSFPDGHSLAVVLPDVLILSAKGRSIAVEAASGKVVRELPEIGVVNAVSRDGWFLATRDGVTSLWQGATGAQATRLRVLPEADLVLGDGGKLAFFLEGADLDVYRFADGRLLRRALPDLDFDVTDEGVFDVAHVASPAFRVRRGPDVERGTMGPLTLLPGELGRTNLYADFVAGNPVGPKPAP